MTFKNERQLQKRIANLSFDLFSDYPVSFIRREVRVGGCIPDLVSVHFETDPSLFSWPNKWSTKHSFVIWLLRKQSLSLEEIASAFFEPIEKVRPTVDYIVSSGLAYVSRQKKISLSDHVRNNFQANVVAVEAKLRDWRQALEQAKRYREFANIVFVAIDASTLLPLRQCINDYNAEKIGLCAVSANSMNWVVKPEIHNNDIGHEKEYLVMSATIPTTQRFWARRNIRNASNHA